MLTKLCSDLDTIYHLNQNYRDCIRLMALCVVLVFLAAFCYSVTQNPFSLFPLGLASIFIMFAGQEVHYISKRMSEYTEPVLMEIAPMGKTEDIVNPDRLFYALEISLIELESGYMVARAAHNINIIIARLSKLNCCANSISTKFYKIFHILDQRRPSEYVCGLWVFSSCFAIGVFIHNFFMYGTYSAIGIGLFITWIIAVWGTHRVMNSIFADLHMTRLYYDNPEKHGDAFSEYNDSRFKDATDEAV